MNITIEELRELLKRTSEVLESLEIPHHFTGGIAASIHGEPRFTQDIDVVVEIPKLDTKAKTLYEALIQHFDVNEPSLRDAIYRQSIFQALDRELLIKVDFHIGEAIPGELTRSRVIEVAPGLQVRMVSKERFGNGSYILEAASGYVFAQLAAELANFQTSKVSLQDKIRGLDLSKLAYKRAKIGGPGVRILAPSELKTAESYLQ